jgi:hypothetical protein
MNRPIAFLFALLVTGACVSAACGDVCDALHTIDLTDFDVSCTQASDCTPVFTGSFCTNCTCPDSAINVADMAKYQAEAQAKESGADRSGPVCDCLAALPTCVQGRCSTESP